MSSIRLPNEQWSKILKFLRRGPNVYGRRAAHCRRFIEGVLWITRSGAQWRLLPASYGKWNTVYKRFARCCEAGVWEAWHQLCVQDPDLEALLLDSTIIRAHACAAGASKQNGGQAAQALGRSRGGFSTKIHVSVDALSNPLRFRLTAGQRHDITQAEALMPSEPFAVLIADKAYEAEPFLKSVVARGAVPVIPPRSNRKTPRDYDKHLYRERHLVECFMNKIKYYRRVFTHFDKLDRCYLGFVCFVGALIRLR